jgi:hypothetical protein
MSGHDAVFEPLLGKGRTLQQALREVAQRWVAAPIEDGGTRAALEDSVKHLLRRAVVRRELPAGADTEALARAFVAALVAGQGSAAVERVLPPSG